MPPEDSPATLLPRAGYLGPQGTFSEEALLSSVDRDAVEPVALETIRDAVLAVQDGAVQWSLVPIENSIEGSVTVTLDALAGEASDVAIVGEAVLPVRHYLIARTSLELTQIGTIVSHPHVPGQCTRFLRERLPHVQVVAATSTAEAVRLVAERAEDGGGIWAAIGTRLAADLYRCTVIAREIQDREDNETRFVWLARRDSPVGGPPLLTPGSNSGKTSLVFWGAGADRAGWLVLCLDEFARRAINLTKIESRPMRERLGQYMFFVDLEGSLGDEAASSAIEGLRSLCEQVRVLGSYPAAADALHGSASQLQ
ncbi:MAG TPA: prephenate dehydratase [Solirubrobacteraceae bacterium]|jgi:prephenate dehydratase|nr:prephenate dehydratase [Solirubrobacteraceae bacterium]